MDALPGAIMQAFAHLWNQHPEVAAGIYAAGAVAAAVPNYIPNFEQAKVWYQKPIPFTTSVAKPVHTIEDAAGIVKSIVTKVPPPTLVTVTSSVSPACNTPSTVEQQAKVEVLDTSSSSELIQDISESVTESSARSKASRSSQLSSERSTPRDTLPEISSKSTERSLSKTTSTSSEKSNPVREVSSVLGTKSSNVTNAGFKARMSRLLQGSRSSAASKESTISDTPRDVTSTGSPTVGKVPRTTSPVVVEQLPVTSQSFDKIIDYSFETITIPQRSKTVFSAPLSSTASIDSGLKEHKSAFTHYRQHAASKSTRSTISKTTKHKPAFTHYRQKAARKSLQDSSSSKTLPSAPVSSTKHSTVTPREHKPAVTPYREKPASKPLRDSPSFAKSQLSRWNDFRRAIQEKYVTQQADQKPSKPSYYSSPITMTDIMVGYVPSILFAVCDHLYKEDPDIQEMVAFMLRNAYMFVVGYLAYAEFRLPTLPYSNLVAYARSIGSVSYSVWQKAVADFLGKQQTDHFIIGRALYASLIGIAIYFLLFAGRRTPEVVDHEQDESDLSEDEDMSETQDLSPTAPAVMPHRKETLIRCCIGFTVVITVIWLSVYVQDLAVILASVPAVHVLSIYDEEARNTIFTILDLVVCGSYRSIIAARTWIRYYAAIAVVVYVLIHIDQPSLCADRLFRGGVAPPFSHFAVVLKLVGLSYVDSLVHGIIEVARISIAKFRVVKAWARYKFMLIVRGRAVFPWHPKTVGGLFHWVLAIITLGPRTVFGLLPVWAGPVVMMFALWALTYAFIPLFQSLFTAIWHTIQPWTERTSHAAAHTVKEFTTSTASIPAPVKGSTSWTAVTTTALRNWVTPSRKLTPTSRERATSSYVYTATSTERATSSRIPTTLSSAWATKSVRNATYSFITATQKTTSSAFEKISMNLSLLYRAQIKPVVSSLGTRCLSNWCQGLAYHWVWRAATIIAVTSVCTVGWIMAAQAYPAHKVRSSFTFAASFMMMYVLGTNGVLACTQDYGIIFATVLVILLLLAYWRPDPIVARDTPNEPLAILPDEVVAPDSAPPSPPAAQIPIPTNDVEESESLIGESDTPNQPPDIQPEQAPQPPSDSQAVDLLDEDLSGLPDEVDALPTQQQASPVQTPVGTPTREQSIETPDQAQAHTETPTADAWTQTTASLPWPQRWMTWLFDSEAARTAREDAIEAARAAAEQEHKDFLEQSGLAGGVDYGEPQSSDDASESPAADSSMISQPTETEQQHRATVETEKPEEAMAAIPSETAIEAIPAPVAQVPAIPVVADTSASLRTLTPAATFKRTPLFEPTPATTTTPMTTASLPPIAATTLTTPATTTSSTIAPSAIPAISSDSLIVPTPLTTPTDVPKSATDTTEPEPTLDITFDLPTIVVNAPEAETQGEYTPMTFVPIEMTELATPAKPTPLKDPASEPVNASEHQAPDAGSVQDQGEDDGQDDDQDGVQESDEEEEEEEDEDEEEFDFGGSPTIGTSAPLQPASPVNAEIAAALEKYREEVRREAEQKKALISMEVASGGAPAPDDGDDNDNGNGDGKADNDSGNAPIPGVPNHSIPKPDNEPSSPKNAPMGGTDDNAPAATPTTSVNTTVPDLLSHPAPGTANSRPWAPFSSLPSSRTEPPMFTQEELDTQFALPAIYNRPAARPTDPKHPDSAEQWRNRLLGGPSMLTIMRREREAAARRASGDDGDSPSGPGGPFGGDGGSGGGDGGGGGSDDTPSPFDPSSGSGRGNPPSPSGSAGSGPMEGIDEASSSDEGQNGESDPHSHNNDDGQTLDNQADTNDQMDNGDDGNEGGGDNYGDLSAQPGASNFADIPVTTPAALDAIMTADDDGDVDMSDLFNVDVDDTSLDDINMDNINLDNINLDGIDFDKIANSGFDNEQTPATTTDDMRRQLVPLEGIEQHIGMPTSLYMSPEDEEYGEMAARNIFAEIDAYEAQNGPINTSPPMSESQQYPTEGESFDHLLGNAGDEYSLPAQQPSVIVPGPPKDAPDAFDPFSNANWGAGFGDAAQAEKDDDVSYEETIRSAAANAFGEDQEPARDDLASPTSTHGDDLNLEDRGVAEDHEELVAGLSNVNLDNDQSDNNDKAQVSPGLGTQRVWDSDFNKAPENAEHEYKHPDEFTTIRPRTRLVQLREDHRIVENPEHAENRSAGLRSLDELTGRQGQVFREVPMDTYELRGASHDDYKDAQELMAWFDPDAEGAEPRGDPSPAGSDDGSALSGEIDDDELDALAKEVEKDQVDELNKASKRRAREVSDDSDSDSDLDSEAPQKTPDGPATPQKESSGARASTPKKGRFRGPVSFDTEEEVRFEKNDVEKVLDLPVFQRLKEANAASTTPSPAQPSPIVMSGLPTRPSTKGTLNAPSMSSSNPTSPFSYDRPPPPSPLAGGFAPGGYARSYNPVTLHERKSTSPYAGIPTLGNLSAPRGQSGNATLPPRSPSYPAMKLPDAALSNARSLLKPASARHRAQPASGTATTNSPAASPAYMPTQPPAGMKFNIPSITPPAYDPTQPAAGYTPKTASNFRAQLLPLDGLSVPQKPLPQLSATTDPIRPVAQDEDAVGDQTSQTPEDDDKNDYDSDIDSIYGHD